MKGCLWYYVDWHNLQEGRKIHGKYKSRGQRKDKRGSESPDRDRERMGAAGWWKKISVSVILSDPAQSDLKAAYEELYQLIQDKDYYIVTTLTDGAIYEMPFDKNRIVAPLWKYPLETVLQSLHKRISGKKEKYRMISVPHCKAPLTGNTLKAETYIEEGYLPRWKDYMKWQTGTINRSLVILELGEGFSTPTVMRWPFWEDHFIFNQKSKLYRINENFYQLPKEAEERGVSVHENSVRWMLEK